MQTQLEEVTGQVRELSRELAELDPGQRLYSFISERGKITPRRISGVCTPHQKRLSEAIKQARNIALVAFASRV